MRPGLREAMAACRAGDTLVVTKLDRLARSVSDARDIADELTAKGIVLSLGGSTHDPTDPVGRLLFNVPGLVTEFEADLIRMRTREGMAVAKAKGRLKGKQHRRPHRGYLYGGSPRALVSAEHRSPRGDHCLACRGRPRERAQRQLRRMPQAPERRRGGAGVRCGRTGRTPRRLVPSGGRPVAGAVTAGGPQSWPACAVGRRRTAIRTRTAGDRGRAAAEVRDAERRLGVLMESSQGSPGKGRPLTRPAVGPGPAPQGSAAPGAVLSTTFWLLS